MERTVMFCKLFLGATVALLLSTSGARAQGSAKPVTIKYALPTPEAEFLPLYAGRDKGFFRRENLDFDVYTLSTGDKMTVALVSGSVEIASYTPDPFIRAMEKGASIKLFMGHSNVPVYSLVVRGDINNYADLKGKRIGVSNLKASDAYIVRKMMTAKGLQERDYVLIQAGSSSERAAALRAGSVSGTLIIPPFDQRVVDEGYKRLDVTSNVIDRYTWLSHAVREDWARTNRPTMLAFIRGWVRATRWVYDPANKSESIKLLEKELKLEERYARPLYEMYFESKNIILAQDGALDTAGLQAVIDAMAEQGDLKPPLPQPDRYIDLSYWHEALKSIR
jgi:ABC-type nitrate/sulfonate/bicarbonate transport system substrate-binding protein